MTLNCYKFEFSKNFADLALARFLVKMSQCSPPIRDPIDVVCSNISIAGLAKML